MVATWSHTRKIPVHHRTVGGAGVDAVAGGVDGNAGDLFAMMTKNKLLGCGKWWWRGDGGDAGTNLVV